jgi:precorrin-8X/cobalt-precorrin-8 methylmutase
MEKGILLLGHGSRREAANEGLKMLAKMAGAGLGMRVEPVYFQFSHPNLADGVARLVADGVKEIIIVPAFLFPGVHFTEDLPEALEELQQEYGEGVRFVLTPCIGPDPRLAEIVLERVEGVDGDGAGIDWRCPQIRSPQEITARSRDLIEDSLGEEFFKRRFTGSEGEVVRRVVHATGNPSVARLIKFHPDAVESGVAALQRGVTLFTDVRMVKVGINRSALRELGGRAICLIHHPQVQAEARETGVTRAIAAVRAFREHLPGSVVVIGNAPTALEEVLDQVEQGLKPALIVGTPVGFVGAAESKARLLRQEIPFITLTGRQGGSTVAVAVVNALLALARGQAGL